eukprot:6629970-Pyramimonas_sp.AAC.1
MQEYSHLGRSDGCINTNVPESPEKPKRETANAETFTEMFTRPSTADANTQGMRRRDVSFNAYTIGLEAR